MKHIKHMNAFLRTAIAMTTLSLPLASLAAGEVISVYKSPTCGCCEKWIAYLRGNGFEVNAVNVKDLGLIKQMAGIKPEQASCHTARVAGYLIEGHVPAGDIRRLLAERPKIRGLTVPGMPAASPGMDSPQHVPYQVLTLEEGNEASRVYASH
jgi:hypothetical protein